MDSHKKWLKDFRKKLSPKKIKEIYFEKGIFIDDIHAKRIFRNFPEKIDPILKRYLEKEFIKHVAYKHLRIQISDEEAIRKLNEIRFHKDKIKDYWSTLNEEERKVLKESFKHHDEEIERAYKKIARRFHLEEPVEKDNFPLIIGTILLVASFVGIISSIAPPTITGAVTGDFATGIETGSVKVLSAFIWSLSSIFGMSLIYSNLKRDKKVEDNELPEFYKESNFKN